jgi:Domain of unknown function (DUF4383)
VPLPTIGGGAIYLVLWLYGLIVGQDSGANFVPLNPADDWLHLILGLGIRQASSSTAEPEQLRKCLAPAPAGNVDDITAERRGDSP